jgi:hypothetical protein
MEALDRGPVCPAFGKKYREKTVALFALFQIQL